MSQRNGETGVRYRILAVDDSPEVIDVILAALGDDVRLLAATSGEQGLAVAASALPDLILLDVMMPGMDGFEVCRRLKGDPGTRDIPVIFVTGLDSKGDELAGLELGAVDFVTKPIEPVILRARVLSHVELACTRKALSKAHRHLADERELIADIITSMRKVHQFCDDHLGYVSHSGGEASGDLVFSAKCPAGCQHVLLGDFTGHGLPAAIGTPLVSHLFYTLTGEGRPMNEILTTLNDVLVRQLPVNIFMAAVALSIPTDGEPVQVWSFGAPDVMHRDAAGKWHALGSQELPMGVVPANEPYQFRSLALPASEHLFVLTDGAIETQCRDGSLFGTQRLVDAIEEKRLQVEPVIEEVLRQADPGVELDDITLLRVSREESGQ